MEPPEMLGAGLQDVDLLVSGFDPLAHSTGWLCPLSCINTDVK
jgi:hypothetical protein